MSKGDGMLLVLQVGDRVVRHFIEPLSCEAFGRDRLAPPDLNRLLRDKLALHKVLVRTRGIMVKTPRLFAETVSQWTVFE